MSAANSSRDLLGKHDNSVDDVDVVVVADTVYRASGVYLILDGNSGRVRVFKHNRLACSNKQCAALESTGLLMMMGGRFTVAVASVLVEFHTHIAH